MSLKELPKLILQVSVQQNYNVSPRDLKSWNLLSTGRVVSLISECFKARANLSLSAYLFVRIIVAMQNWSRCHHGMERPQVTDRRTTYRYEE
jgi:hypothetical protein